MAKKGNERLEAIQELKSRWESGEIIPGANEQVQLVALTVVQQFLDEGIHELCDDFFGSAAYRERGAGMIDLAEVLGIITPEQKLLLRSYSLGLSKIDNFFRVDL
jgi:hypothetical protein